jgi:hypothetical protein
MLTFNTSVENGKIITDELIDRNIKYNIDFTNILSDGQQIFIFQDEKLEMMAQLTFAEYL